MLHILLHLLPQPWEDLRGDGDGQAASQSHQDPQVLAPFCGSRAGQLRVGVRCPQNRSAHSFNIVIQENGE